MALHDFEEEIGDAGVYSLSVVRTATGYVAMGEKQRGFGTGRPVCPGGKQCYLPGALVLMPDPRTPSREFYEKTGVQIPETAWRRGGTLCIETPDDERMVYLCVAHLAARVALRGCDELANPRWVDERSLPFSQMPEDYRYWFPQLLAGHLIHATFEIDDEGRLYGTVINAPPVGDTGGRVIEVMPEGSHIVAASYAS